MIPVDVRTNAMCVHVYGTSSGLPVGPGPAVNDPPYGTPEIVIEPYNESQ